MGKSQWNERSRREQLTLSFEGTASKHKSGKPSKKGRRFRRRNRPHISGARIYDSQDAAQVLGVSYSTLRNYVRAGLSPLHSHTSPLLFLGRDLIEFTRNLRQNRKHKLPLGCFYCLRCRTAVMCDPASISPKKTGYYLWGGIEQVLVTGQCSVCGRAVHYLTTTRRLPDFLTATKQVWKESEGQYSYSGFVPELTERGYDPQTPACKGFGLDSSQPNGAEVNSKAQEPFESRIPVEDAVLFTPACPSKTDKGR